MDSYLTRVGVCARKAFLESTVIFFMSDDPEESAALISALDSGPVPPAITTDRAWARARILILHRSTNTPANVGVSNI